MSLTGVVSTTNSTPDGWLEVDRVVQAAGGLDVALVLRKGKKGRTLATWDVCCRGVREFEFSDLTGGGIRLYSSDHPAAKQYTATATRLSCRTSQAGAQAWLALVAAHREAVDDWVPLDRYLPATPPTNGTIAVRAPLFLARAYARALRSMGLNVRLVHSKHPPKRGTSPKVLHLGNSFVVADAFEVREGLANKQMQRTKRG